LFDYIEYVGVCDLMRDLNRVYCEELVFWEVDFLYEGFVWIELNDVMGNIVVFMCVSVDKTCKVVCIANLVLVLCENYRVGFLEGGVWEEFLNMDSIYYGGIGIGNFGEVKVEECGWHD